MSPANLFTKRRWIAELARKRERASIGECRWEMVDSYDQLRHRRRNSPAKHRMRVICTSGSVGGEGGNILAYPAKAAPNGSADDGFRCAQPILRRRAWPDGVLITIHTIMSQAMSQALRMAASSEPMTGAPAWIPGSRAALRNDAVPGGVAIYRNTL